MSDDAKPAAKPHVEIYTDGACEPNPGPGGYGAVLLHPKKRLEISGGFRLTTNNRMEIYAAIKGLELLNQPCEVTLYSDSQYLVSAMMEGWVAAWKAKDWWRTNKERAVNVDLWKRLETLCATHQVEFRWVRGQDTFAAPSGIVGPHVADEGNQFPVQAGPPSTPARFPAPEQTKAQPMPVQHCSGLQDHQRPLPVGPATSQPRPE